MGSAPHCAKAHAQCPLGQRRAEPALQGGKPTGNRFECWCLQPTPQELRRQPLQPPREQREPIGEEQNAQEDEQRSRDPVHPTEIAPEQLEPPKEPLQRERSSSTPNADAVAPSAMKMAEKPATNHTACASAVPRRRSISGSDSPVRNPT